MNKQDYWGSAALNSLHFSRSASAHLGQASESSESGPVRVLHIITGLQTGGAGMMLYKLLAHMDRRRFSNSVISLIEPGAVGPMLESLNIPVTTLGMKPSVASPISIAALAHHIRQSKPDLIQTWMYHSDLLGGIAGALSGHVPVVWNIRRGSLNKDVTKPATRWVARACALLASNLPCRIVCCSEAAATRHAEFGYPRKRITIIPNGFDLDSFRPEAEARNEIRDEFGIPRDALVIGLVARFHPTKGHANFLKAAGLLLDRCPDVHFVLCGNGVSWNNLALAQSVEAAGTSARFHFEGRRDDIRRIMAAVDIATSSSIVEGFPNAVGEAMACAKPCVVTDVGDCAYLVGDTGIVVPPSRPDMLADAWMNLIEAGAAERDRRGAAARLRVEEQFSIDAIAGRYQDLYGEVLKLCVA